jgi:hypothetical protein
MFGQMEVAKAGDVSHLFDARTHLLIRQYGLQHHVLKQQLPNHTKSIMINIGILTLAAGSLLKVEEEENQRPTSLSSHLNAATKSSDGQQLKVHHT